MRRGTTRPNDLTVLERRATVFRLRQSGATYREIARAMGDDPAWQGRLPSHYNARKAHGDVKAELQRLRTELDEQVALWRALELARLDRLLLSVWARALRGDLQAVDAVLRIMKQRARLLPGLEVPLAVAPTTPSGMAPYPSSVDTQAYAELLAAFGRERTAEGE